MKVLLSEELVHDVKATALRKYRTDNGSSTVFDVSLCDSSPLSGLLVYMPLVSVQSLA